MSNREDVFQTACSVVRMGLKCPATAVFSDRDFIYNEATGQFIGYVDAQNSFGAMVRSRFIGRVEMGRIVSLFLDDGKDINWLIQSDEDRRSGSKFAAVMFIIVIIAIIGGFLFLCFISSLIY